MKVIINKCFGGFVLSNLALKRYIEPEEYYNNGEYDKVNKAYKRLIDDAIDKEEN